MSVSGLCDICRTADVDRGCDRCGKLVCDDHFDDEVGVCVECAVEIGRQDRPGIPHDDEDLPDGVDTYRL